MVTPLNQILQFPNGRRKSILVSFSPPFCTSPPLGISPRFIPLMAVTMSSPNELSGNATVRYFERDQFIGSRETYCCGYADSSGKRSSAYWPNTAYVCPVCGELWARAIYEHHFQYEPIPQAPWIVEVRRCAEHGDGYFLVGLGNSASHLSLCSLPLLAREALLLCIHNKGLFI